MNFEARYIDVGPGDGTSPIVVAIWCVLNGRFRRFSVDNVAASQAAGHRFYVQDVSRAHMDVHVVRSSPESQLHTDADGIQRNTLIELPDWAGD